MSKRRTAGILVTAVAAATLLVPATPAAAYHYDCKFMGPSYIVHDTIDCAYYVLQHLG